MLGKTKLIFIIMLMVLVSCVPQADTNRRTKKTPLSSEQTTDNSDLENSFDDPAGTDLDQEESNDIFWYDSERVDGTLLINEDINTVLYLRGGGIENFINRNNNSVYCLVVNFDTVDVKQQLRMRAVVISFNNFQEGRTEKLLRLDINERDNNFNQCRGTLTNPNGQAVNDANSAFTPEELCPTCTGRINSISQGVQLYQQGSFGIDDNQLVPNTEINLSILSLRVDTENNATDPVGSCEDSQCQAQGFDCCLDGQCVNDAEEKPNASSNPDYNQARADVAQNPENFVNWPNIFFVCQRDIKPQPTPTPLPDNEATADARFEQEKKDFFCLEGAKQDPADYSQCSPDGDFNSFTLVREDVWRRCGCEPTTATPPPDDPENSCPDFGLRAVRDGQDEIIAIECVVPEEDPQPTPFQNLDIGLSARTVPHRFFSTSGEEFNSLTEAAQANATPEGQEFKYLDPANKSDPESGDFNMNAILGQMSLALDQAKPAVVLNVEFDAVYLISTNSGFYTPCPDCSSDSWFDAFTAHPGSSSGVGLGAVGHTTRRDIFSTNSTRGNYEDTIFGRACWLPPTMVPFSHSKSPNLATQRQNRLATQAALYMNGYQRDWFGFNKGAVIGSFNGVNWFAVGKGRRVRATSNKMFIAINSPFGDLADNTDLAVSVVLDQGNNTAAEFDYDPDLEPTDGRQNQAGTCQRYHICDTDSDCVSQLGWEYVCVQTNSYRTLWPQFDINGNELANEERLLTASQLIQGGVIPGDSTKRCVYRGAGAPCKKDYSSISNSTQRKLFTCATNFYCEDLSENLNNEIVRTPNELDTITFGQEANVLGRPPSYVGGTKDLTGTIKGNLRATTAALGISGSETGICRPGKALGTNNPVDQHANKDNSRRTDYISQIGSCNSSALGGQRVNSCPLFDEDGNIVQATTDYTDEQIDLLLQQNFCGKPSQNSAFQSPFQQIEGVPLPSANSIDEETLVQDACLRKAGSFCQTDLDCGPNRLHEDQVDIFGLEYFGNTQAEKDYWRESLVCGQRETIPFSNDPAFNTYDIKENRCCRPVGQDITLYTQGSNDTIIPDLGDDNLNLRTNTMPADDPRADGRYSRYSIIAPIGIAEPAGTPYAEVPLVDASTSPRQFQWKTISDTADKSCCGGGWIRKFADGTTNWSVTNRLKLDIENFKCLNYNSEIPFEQPAFVSRTQYEDQLARLCIAPGDGGCMQVEMERGEGFEIIPPQINTVNSVTLDTFRLSEDEENTISGDAPFRPDVFDNTSYPQDRPDSPFMFGQYQDSDEVVQTDSWVALQIPAYMNFSKTNRNNLISIQLQYLDENNDPDTTSANDADADSFVDIFVNGGVSTEVQDCVASPSTVDFRSATQEQFCITSDSETIFIAAADDHLSDAGRIGHKARIIFTFRPSNKDATNYDFGNGAGADSERQAMTPGSAMYYLSKLGRLELLGIPQIFYEPIYCNNNRDLLIPEMFTELASDNNDRSAFDNASLPYTPQGSEPAGLNLIYDDAVLVNDDANPNERVVYQDKINHGQIFSGHEFKCCVPVGESTDDSGRCCSGAKLGQEGDQGRCVLPSGTNVNVYLNRFVSNEGSRSLEEPDDEGNEGPPLFTDDDFISLTGEPKFTDEVYDKIIQFARAHCPNGDFVRKGGAFGKFPGEPRPSGPYRQLNPDVESVNIFGIVDSTLDNNDTDSFTNGTPQGTSINTGFNVFISGFRWNHHIYCE